MFLHRPLYYRSAITLYLRLNLSTSHPLLLPCAGIVTPSFRCHHVVSSSSRCHHVSSLSLRRLFFAIAITLATLAMALFAPRRLPLSSHDAAGSHEGYTKTRGVVVASSSCIASGTFDAGLHNTCTTVHLMRLSTRRPLPDMFRKIFAQWEQSFCP